MVVGDQGAFAGRIGQSVVPVEIAPECVTIYGGALRTQREIAQELAKGVLVCQKRRMTRGTDRTQLSKELIHIVHCP